MEGIAGQRIGALGALALHLDKMKGLFSTEALAIHFFTAAHGFHPRHLPLGSVEDMVELTEMEKRG